MWKRLKQFIKAVIFQPVWAVAPYVCRQRRQKHILLATNRDKFLMMGSLAAYYDLLKDDPSLSFSVTTVEKLPVLRTAAKSWGRERHVRYVSFLRARLMSWEMIIAADHHVVKFFNPQVAAILIPHGISSGKLFKGEIYKYLSSNIQRPDGAMIYSRILECTQSIHDDVCGRRPTLRKIVKVVGSLQADVLLAQKKNRTAIRQGLGFQADDRVILIMSTFGGASLMETIGERLIAQCRKLVKDAPYKFILTTHPHHWSGEYSQQQPYGKFLRRQEGDGFTVIQPQQDWAPYLIASDMAIADHTSLAVYFSLLQKPMLMARVPGATLATGGPSDKLLRNMPFLRDIGRLKEEIEAAAKEFSPRQMAALTKEFHSCPGQAASLMRQQFYEVLLEG